MQTICFCVSQEKTHLDTMDESRRWQDPALRTLLLTLSDSSGDCWWNAAIAVTRWPLREEGRRQVDIWPVCYCEFQICWLSGSAFNLRFQRRFTRGVAAHLSLTCGENQEKRHLTHSRARVGFRFNVCSHVGRPHSSHPLGDVTEPDEKQPRDPFRRTVERGSKHASLRQLETYHAPFCGGQKLWDYYIVPLQLTGLIIKHFVSLMRRCIVKRAHLTFRK